MLKIFVVARREYNAAVRTKSFLISLFLLPLLMGGGAIAQLLLKDQVDVQEKRFGVVDRTAGQTIVAALEAAAQKRNNEELFDPHSGKQLKPAFAIERIAPMDSDTDAIERQRFELSERIRQGELFGFLEIGNRVFDRHFHAGDSKGSAAPIGGSDAMIDARSVRYQSNRPTYDGFRDWARPIVEHIVQESRFKNAGLNGAVVHSALQPVPLMVKGLSQMDQETGKVKEAKDESPVVSILVPAALMIFMFMLILVGATPAMQGVVEEKMQRIAEMLLGSLRPFELMMGKLLGLMGVSLTLSALYLGAGYWAANHYGVAELVPPVSLIWFFVFLMVAVVMYGSLFIAVGAACSDIRDTQTMLWPVMLLAMLPMFVWINVAKEPTSTFSTAISFFPFATPTMMMIRMAVPPGIGWLQPVLGLILMFATTVGCVYVAGRIFRVGLLMQGKGASVRDLIRWIIHG